MLRSMSYKEELNQSLQGKAKALPGLEELFISCNVNDELLPLVCALNTMENKSHPVGFIQETNTSRNPDAEPGNCETARPWDQEEGKYLQKAVEFADFNASKRSKSSRWSPREHEQPPLDPGISDGVKEMGLKSNKGIARCRSFHTVDEYDAMLERIWLSKENLGTEETGLLLTADLETEEGTECDTGGGHGTSEKEPKRKAMAKQLRSLRIPSTIEFPAIASLREWLPMEEQVYSPGACATPKFGSHARTENESGASLPFSPELVAAFEESMKQLETEEERILIQIAEQWDADGTNEEELIKYSY